ncbi:MAG: DMT family transporter [Marinobacterium sp.]|nr:DMT family transporter [Marinobacterium sp.]
MQPGALTGSLLWMSGALSCFIAMAIAGRELSSELSVPQLLMIRSATGLILIGFLISRHSTSLLKTKTPGLHLIRNSVHFAGQYGWFVGIASIPLAEVFALEFTTPIWCLLLAPLIVGEKITSSRAASVLLGFTGILIILRPGLEIIDPAAMAVLAAAAGFAIAYLLTKKITGQQQQSPLTLLFYMCLIQLLLSTPLAFNDWHPVVPEHIPWLLIVSLTALAAHYSIARAMKLADAAIVVPIDFLRLPLIALLGFLLYDEALDFWVISGAAIMLGGNYLNIYTEQRRLKRLKHTPCSKPIR